MAWVQHISNIISEHIVGPTNLRSYLITAGFTFLNFAVVLRREEMALRQSLERYDIAKNSNTHGQCASAGILKYASI